MTTTRQVRNKIIKTVNYWHKNKKMQAQYLEGCSALKITEKKVEMLENDTAVHNKELNTSTRPPLTTRNRNNTTSRDPEPLKKRGQEREPKTPRNHAATTKTESPILADATQNTAENPTQKI